MHERQAVIVVSVLLFSIMFTVESFAEEHQCNGLEATHVGTEGNDRIRGTSSNDVIVSLGGNDAIYGMGGNDIICGGEGNDKLYGFSGNDLLIGGEGSDKLYGGTGIDTCDSSTSDKRVIGCEEIFRKTVVTSDTDDLQKQLNELQDKINKMIFDIIKWTDIQGIPESIADGDDDMLAEIECSPNQLLVFDDEQWVCQDMPENYSEDIFDDLNCEDGQIIMKNDEEWVCEDQIMTQEDTLKNIDCSTDEIVKWNGKSWECSMDIAFSASPIFFHHSRIIGTETAWVGIDDFVEDAASVDKISIVMPTSGELSKLYAKLGKSGDLTIPRDGETYIITIIKNDIEETELECIITEFDDFCNSGGIKVSVVAGDTIALKTKASDNAPLAIIGSSVFFAGTL